MDIRSDSLKIGKFFEIELYLAYSWFIIFTLITGSLIFGFLPAFYPEITLSLRIIAGLVISVIFFISVVIHEFSHAIYALRSGLTIRRITLFVFGGVAEIIDEPEDPKTEFTMAVLGPLASLAIAGIFGILWYLNVATINNLVLTAITASLAGINAGVAIFNLLPGYPLDGGRIFRSIIWHFTDDVVKATRISSYGGRGLSLLMITYGGLLFLSGGFLDGSWIILLGWFLNRAAKLSYRQTLLHHSVKNIPIDKMIDNTPIAASPQDTLVDIFENDPLRFNRQSILPVTENNELKGIVDITDLKPRNLKKKLTVSELMEEISPSLIVTRDDSASSLLKKFRLASKGELPVVSNRELIGVINRNDLLRYASTQKDTSS